MGRCVANFVQSASLSRACHNSVNQSSACNSVVKWWQWCTCWSATSVDLINGQPHTTLFLLNFGSARYIPWICNMVICFYQKNSIKRTLSKEPIEFFWSVCHFQSAQEDHNSHYWTIICSNISSLFPCRLHNHLQQTNNLFLALQSRSTTDTLMTLKTDLPEFLEDGSFHYIDRIDLLSIQAIHEGFKTQQYSPSDVLKTCMSKALLNLSEVLADPAGNIYNHNDHNGNLHAVMPSFYSAGWQETSKINKGLDWPQSFQGPHNKIICLKTTELQHSPRSSRLVFLYLWSQYYPNPAAVKGSSLSRDCIDVKGLATTPGCWAFSMSRSQSFADNLRRQHSI